MRPVEVYERWAPPDCPWSLWVTPALFTQLRDTTLAQREGSEPVSGVTWAPPATAGTGVVIDLPGAEAVWYGVAVARCGYRPVPIFEACTGPHELIDQRPVMRALVVGASILKSVPLPSLAPPAFLVDARRTTPPGGLRPRAFDNRWRVSPFDFPSAAALTTRGVRRVLLVQRGRLAPRADMARVLSGWQDAGLSVVAKDVATNAVPRPVRPARSRWYRVVRDRLAARLGWRPAWPGGFGITE